MTVEAPKRRCSCGVTLVAERVVRNQHGGLVAAHYRCASCGASFGATSVGRVMGMLVGVGVFGFFGAGALSQVTNPTAPTAVVASLGAASALLALAFLVLAVKTGLTLSRHPIVKD